jgi:hypothetical protein
MSTTSMTIEISRGRLKRPFRRRTRRRGRHIKALGSGSRVGRPSSDVQVRVGWYSVVRLESNSESRYNAIRWASSVEVNETVTDHLYASIGGRR